MGNGTTCERLTGTHPHRCLPRRTRELHLTVHGTDKNILTDITGRIRAQTMNALMGGSGAGKTSLLNALCGRAFYGDVAGAIFVNGVEGQIQDIMHCVGFVPQVRRYTSARSSGRHTRNKSADPFCFLLLVQDDIVYGELTGETFVALLLILSFISSVAYF